LYRHVPGAIEDLREDSEHRGIVFDAENTGHGGTLPGGVQKRQSAVEEARSKGPVGPNGLATYDASHSGGVRSNEAQCVVALAVTWFLAARAGPQRSGHVGCFCTSVAAELLTLKRQEL
jgi:hypothetical protein